jgi:hypothetical protein
MDLKRFRPRKLLNRWAAMVQLGFFEANNGSTATRRLYGINRVKVVATRYALLAACPAFILVLPDSLGLHETPVWWFLASLTGGWAVFMLSAMAAAVGISMYRAARVRLAADRGEPSRYPRK